MQTGRLHQQRKKLNLLQPNLFPKLLMQSKDDKYMHVHNSRQFITFVFNLSINLKKTFRIYQTISEFVSLRFSIEFPVNFYAREMHIYGQWKETPDEDVEKR